MEYLRDLSWFQYSLLFMLMIINYIYKTVLMQYVVHEECLNNLDTDQCDLGIIYWG